MMWQPIKSVPKDGTVFLALDLGRYPALVQHRRPNKKYKRKRWFIVASQGAMFQVDDLATREMTKWVSIPDGGNP